MTQHDGGIERGGRSAWADQTAARERAFREFVDSFTTLIEAGQTQQANLLVREMSIAEILMHGVELHTSIAAAMRSDAFASVLTPQYPGLLIIVAIARSEASGTIVALKPALRQAARALLARKVSSIGVRARNLSLASFALFLAGDEGDSRDIGRRTAELVLSVEPGAAVPDLAELCAAAVDVALSFVLSEQFEGAIAVWTWVRERLADPTSATLMQADWGLSIVGGIGANRAMMSPLAQWVFSHDERVDDESIATDPWWALVQTARSWAALDAFDAQRALAISRRALERVTNPRRNAPLSSMHAIALMACGYGAAAADFFDRQGDTEPIKEWPERSWRVLLTVMARSLAGADVSDLLDSRALREDPDKRAIGTAYAWLVAGTGRTPAVKDIHPEAGRSLRVQTLAGLVRAATELRLGNDAAAVAALQTVDSLHAARGRTGWALLLPDTDVQALRELAVREEMPALADALPARTAVHAVEPPVELTDREREVLHLLQRGHTNAEIAGALFISPNTVKFHVANILKRLGVTTREEAAALGGGGVRRRSDGSAG